MSAEECMCEVVIPALESISTCPRCEACREVAKSALSFITYGKKERDNNEENKELTTKIS